jgi:hypothetical protein
VVFLSAWWRGFRARADQFLLIDTSIDADGAAQFKPELTPCLNTCFHLPAMRH